MTETKKPHSMAKIALASIALVAAVIGITHGESIWNAINRRAAERSFVHEGIPILHVYSVKRWGRARGDPHGHFVSYFRDTSSKQCEGRYEHGQKTGVWIWWSREGIMDCQQLYRFGALQEERRSPPWFVEAPDC